MTEETDIIMKKLLVLVIISIFTFQIWAQNGSIQMLRYNDNFQYLQNDTTVKKGFEQLKVISFGNKKATISFGGELREQVQHFENQNFGDVPPVFKAVSVTQVWHRAMLHANLELGKKIRVFGQLNQTMRFFNPNPLNEIDQNKLGLHQAFVEIKPTSNWIIRVGRQELSYGNNRMLTFREGPNNRLAFDAAIVQWKNKTWRIDAIAASPVAQLPNIGDDVSLKDKIFGLYTTKTIVPKKLLLDVYGLFLNSERIKYNLVAGKENRTVLGTRIFSQNPFFNYELEANYQVGTFNTLNINAFGLSYDVKYRFEKAPKWSVGLAGNYISGDKTPTDNQLNTYNLLFSKPSFGLAAPIGASNIINTNPYVSWQPNKKWSLLAGIYFLSKASVKDGTYSPGMVQVRPSRKEVLFQSDARKIGNQYAAEIAYFHNRHWAFFTDAAYFTPGAFATETGKGKAITYLSAKAAYKF